ncbi:AraC-type DNA-binding protein [Nonomuraea solani]|uniref:AraC-type DNA-binding protein n=1 Tax=Nonomuraea solani TaxID=1144553 RepID=A0A1H6F3L8_9ACTN|nr:helix-turn-helix domain-containing protein [Nonomuraea solani]SEH03839.1 AraC-type DNA-binding protein [Nonomuraea solani]
MGGTFSVDTAAHDGAGSFFDAFRRGWETEIGAAFPLPTFSPETADDLRGKIRASKVHDTVITDIRVASDVRTVGALDDHNDEVRMYVMRRGAWMLTRPRDRSEVTVPAGRILLRYNGWPSHFQVVPGTTARVLSLPASPLRPLIGDRQIVATAGSPETRLLMAHANMVHATLNDLTPAGAQAARNALVELAEGVMRQRVDGAEPLLAPALARAAKDLTDDHLADPDLSPAMLARELGVTVRTLQRAFASTDESAAAYIRRRRLEQAGLALTAPSGRPSVSELAAHWQFADSSHFIRAFKRQYGQTPAAYARSTRPS